MGGARWLTVFSRTGAVSLVLAGTAWIWASVQRWWPECRLGELESLACMRLQDNLYDYFVPHDPWVPIGSTATLAGAGAVLLAAGLVLLVPTHAVHRELRLVVPVLAVLAFGMLRDGAETLMSGQAGQAMTAPLLGLLGSPVEIVALFALATLAVRLRSTGARWRSWRGPAPLVASLFLANPLVEFFVLPPSHDTPAWSGAFAGVWMVAAGWAAWWMTAWRSWSDARVGAIAAPAR